MMKTFAAAMLAAATLMSATATAKNEATSADFAPALWVVRDADSTLYLYGTIHLRRTGEPWGDERVRAAINEADEVWTEIEIDPAAEAASAGLMQQYGMAAPGQTLSSVLTPAQAEMLRTRLAGIGVAAEAFEPFRPWLAGITISVVQMMQAGYDPNSGVDRGVDAFAEAAGKRMRWFETPTEQVQFLAGLSEPVQVQMLLDTVADLEGGVALLTRMDSAWSSGNLASLEGELTDEMRRLYPELYDVILTQRNARWVETLTGELEGAGVDFVAVGAAHLIGEESVIAMLEARGLRVERVMP